MLSIILASITAFTISFLAIPSIIRVAYLKNLYDEPDERKSHSVSIPTLGGLAIFAGIMLGVVGWCESQWFPDFQYYIVAVTVIFFVGIKDDILIIAPLKKMVGQVIAATVVVVFGKIELTGLYGFMEIAEIPSYLSIPLSIFTLLVIMNGFNLIDGIDGLSASIGVVTATTFGFWFFLTGNYEWAMLSFVLIGALFGFLYYNLTPAKIFMGDTGSLILGLTVGVLTLKFIHLSPEVNPDYRFNIVPIVAFAILFVPLFDTLRVFTIRVLKGNSPLKPDQNHVHHMLIKLGLSHKKSTGILVLANLFFIGVAFLLNSHMGSLSFLVVLLILGSILSFIPYFLLRRSRNVGFKISAGGAR